MLKSLLFALAMGTEPDLEARAAELERLQGRLISPELVTSQLQTFELVVEFNRISRLGGKLGPALLGDSEDGFEDGVARLHDDDNFAELLGRFARLAAIALDQPSLIARLGAEIGPQDTSSPIAARFATDLNMLDDTVGGSDFVAVFSKMRDTNLLSKMRNTDPKQIGRVVLDAMYDPASTKIASDAAWAIVRLIARAIAVRHIDASQVQFSEEWSTGLFKDSKSDVECLANFVSTFLASNDGQIALMVEAYKIRAKRNIIDEVMSHLSERPEAWTEHFGPPRED